MRANTNIAQKKRYTAKLTDFRGVDFSSSPLKAATTRATYMRNLICENGVNHKRPGWREVLHFREDVDLEVNGIFPFKEGNTDVLLVHAGTKIYRVVCTAGVWGKTNLTGALTLTNTKSQCFYRDGRAYIIGCGQYLVYGKGGGGNYTLTKVQDGCYIPTTTISIDAERIADTQRATLEDVNLLTPWRKNLLVGSADKQGGECRWKLDGTVDSGTSVSIQVEWYHEVEGAQSPTSYKGTLEFSGTVISPETRREGDNALTTTSKVTRVENGNETAIESALGDQPCFWVIEDGTVVASFPTTGIAEHQSNITVLFSSSHGGEVKIATSTTGALFGADGASDRLFLSGNPDEIGMDRWSEAGDFTYFPDGNAMCVGGNEAAITGYARLSDSTLAVFKEQAQGYPTVYYRTDAKTTMTDADGDTVPATYFPVVPGTVGEGLVSAHAVANLAGDPLILSPNGVFGIELSENVASGERYAKERSRAIYEELCHKDLTNAVACVYRGRYYLSVGDGICYVADSRYKTSFDGSPDTGYEWWVWDNVPATAFAVQENTLLFGDAEGRFCRFEEGTFSDRTLVDIKSGDATCNLDTSTITVNGNLNVREGDALVVSGSCMVKLLDVSEVNEGRIVFSDEIAEEMLLHLTEEREVYATFEGSREDLATDTIYTITDIDPATCSFRLKNAEEAVAVEGGDFTLCFSITGRECLLKAHENAFLLTDRAGCVFEIVSANAPILGKVVRYAPVISKWRTPVMELGTSAARKCLLGVTVVNEPGVEGIVKFGIVTRKISRELLEHGLRKFSLDNLDFNEFSFSTGFAESCRRRLNIRNVNFVTLEMLSDTDSDAAVSSIELEYKINQTNRGIY